MKKLRSAIILSFMIGFMFFIFEPITMYANNVNDFWFDFYTLIGPTTLFFLITSVVLVAFFSIVYFVAKKLKKPAIYNFTLLFAGFCFICAYVHSNFLAGSLPLLDGASFNWQDIGANVISVTVCLVVAIIIIYARLRLGFENTAKYLSYISLAIFAMLSVSLVSTCLTTPVFESKDILAISTNKDLYTVSTNKNYIVFLADAVDSTAFNNIVQSNDEYKSALKDFSYFPDTLAGYAFTRDSVPFIFSGVWNENEESFPTYSAKAFDNSAFFQALSADDWKKDIYYEGLSWRSEKAFEFDNIITIDREVSLYHLAAQEIKYDLFKSLPFPLKRFSRADKMNFDAAMNKSGNDGFNWSNSQFYNNHSGRVADTTDKNLFQYIHLEGGHVPFDTDTNMNYLPDENGTYPDKLEVTMKIFLSYLDYLKANGAYDNTTIVFLADHGYAHDGSGRQNPILYVKGEGESHEKMITSEKQVSYADLCEMFIELLDGKLSTEIFSELPTDGRTRRFINNQYSHEEHMVEYEQTDKAWNTSTLKPTGRSFDLK